MCINCSFFTLINRNFEVTDTIHHDKSNANKQAINESVLHSICLNNVNALSVELVIEKLEMTEHE